ncbi:hypothetical protein QFZ75_000353 [Streptomyces sp. V3I8]|nr:hypothetical protein [Streptomyces sp. V3I8]
MASSCRARWSGTGRPEWASIRGCADTVAGLLREEGFSLQANAKTIEGAQHPDRDTQFRYLNEQARDHRDAGDPVTR